MMGPVFWFVGLSGSGKTTLAEQTKKYLESNPDLFPGISRWEIIDGDSVRTFLDTEVGYTFEDRRKSVIIMGLLGFYLSKNNIGVIVANISPFHDLRQKIRKKIPQYYEIFCQCPISTCISRDPKGHYSNLLKNGIKDFVGHDIPFQVPENPDLVVNTHKETLTQCMETISGFLKNVALKKVEK